MSEKSNEEIKKLKKIIEERASELSRSIENVVIGYKFDSTNDQKISFLSVNRKYYSHIHRVFEDENPRTKLSLGEALDDGIAKTIKKNHPAVIFSDYVIDGLSTKNSLHRYLIRDVTSDFFPSKWYARGFFLIDICEFSRKSVSEQVMLRISLESCIKDAVERATNIYKNTKEKDVEAVLGDPSLINLIPAGDGFYIWHQGSGRVVDSFVLAVGVLTLAIWNLRYRSIGARVRSSFCIGSAFTIPLRSFNSDGVPGEVFRDAVGPALNNAARICGFASPGQVLVGEYRGDDISKETIKNETQIVNRASQFLQRINNKKTGKASQINICPPEQVYRAVDKHGMNHNFVNVSGAIYFSDTNNNKKIECVVGLAPNNAKAFASVSFV